MYCKQCRNVKFSKGIYRYRLLSYRVTEEVSYQSHSAMLLPCCRLTTAAQTTCQTLQPTALDGSCCTAIATRRFTALCLVKGRESRHCCYPVQVSVIVLYLNRFGFSFCAPCHVLPLVSPPASSFAISTRQQR